MPVDPSADQPESQGRLDPAETTDPAPTTSGQTTLDDVAPELDHVTDGASDVESDDQPQTDEAAAAPEAAAEPAPPTEDTAAMDSTPEESTVVLDAVRVPPDQDGPARPPSFPPIFDQEPWTTLTEAASPDETAPANQTKKGRPKRRHRKLMWSLVAVFVLLIAVAGGVFYANYYYLDKAAPGSTLAGREVSGQTAAELRRTAQDLVESMRFTFTEGGDSLEGGVDDLGVVADPEAIAQAVLSAGQAEPIWRKLNPWTAKPVPITAKIDQDRLREFLDQEFISEEETTADAAVTYDPETVSFAVVPSVTGLRTEVEPVAEAIAAHLADTSAPAKLEVKAVDNPPAIDDAAATQAADAATAALGRAITFDNGQEGVKSRTFQLPVSSIGAWTRFTADPENGVINVSYDEAAIAAELPALLADQVAIPSRPQIVMTYPDSDKQIGVVQWGLNGLKMADPAPVIAEVSAALAEGREATVAVPLEAEDFEVQTTKPPTNYDEPDGAHWIDVDKTAFIATLYAGTTEVARYVISIGKPGHDTTSGTFYVYLKYDYQVMRGPASDPYESPTNWVSYFNGGIAFHSAPWNEPNNWQRRVSHGCVNMKTAHAKAVFDFAPIGTKVVVHD